ncbi:MAG: phosphoribosylformylglycinamidine cyclo-ligase [Thermoplasmata archaeon]
MKTYAEAGVDIDKKGIFLDILLREIKYKKKGFRMATPIGHYSSLIKFGDYYIAINTDGVGTKMLIADDVGKWDTVGIDAIAMNVNDTVCVGAEPFAFVDYLIIRDYDTKKAREIGRSLNQGAMDAGVTIVGGETAVMPDMVNGTDLSGTSIGYVEIGKEITGRKIRKGDVIVGLESSGLHSNGFTLVRKLLKEKNIDYSEKIGGTKLYNLLLKPTRIYVSTVLESIRNTEVHGIAHITGGGLRNLTRLSRNLFVITDPIKPHRIFNFIMEVGDIDLREMYQTFNMGMGMALIVPEDYSKDVIGISIKNGIGAKVVGHVENGKGVSVPQLNLFYEHY